MSTETPSLAAAGATAALLVLGALGLVLLISLVLGLKRWKLTEARAQRCRDERDRLARVVRGSHDVAWEWDLKDKTLWLSDRWTGLLGLGSPQLHAEPSEWLSRVHPDDRSALDRELQLHRSGRTPRFEHEHRLRHSDGSWRRVLARGLAEWDENSRAIRMTGSFSDITDPAEHRESLIETVGERTRALHLALERERETGDLKTRFIQMVSHEFRTPLSSILTASELLRDHLDKLSSEQRAERFEKIRREVDRITRMLDNVLAISQTGVRQQAFRPRTTDAVRICGDLVAAARVDRPNRRIRVKTVGVARTLLLDPDYFHQMVSNLLSNALKFSDDESTVYVDVCFTPQGLELKVEDEGVGIPPEDIDRLSEPFHRGRNVGNISGTGLGMTIIKEGVEVHGGTLDIQSTIDEGSTFVLKLPEQGPTAEVEAAS